MKKFKFFIMILLLFVLFISSCSGESKNDVPCVVSFNTNGGTEIESVIVNKGDKVNKPDDPIREGYTFDDWYFKGEKWSFIGYVVTEDMTLESNWIINQYNLIVDKNINDAGNIIISKNVYDYNESVSIEVTVKSGYHFDGWFEGDTLVFNKTNYVFNMPAKNLNLSARFSENLDTPYKVEHYQENLEDDNYSLIDEDYLYGQTNSLTAAEINNYTGFNSPSIQQVRINADGSTVLKVYYSRIKKEVFLNVNNKDAGSIKGAGIYKYGEKVTISAETNNGYTFIGWYDVNGLVSTELDYTFNMSMNDFNFEAKWIKVDVIKNIDNAGTITNLIDKYIVGDEVTISAKTNSGYTFIGWYSNDKEVSNELTYTFVMPKEKITYEARWNVNKYVVDIDNNLNDVVVSGVIDGNKYDFGTKITLSATGVPSNTTLKWVNSDNEVFYGNEYIFYVPAEDIIISTKLMPYTKNQKTIYFGSYPQNRVTGSSLISELNSMAGSLPKSNNLYNWTDYNYYISSEITSYMYYQDIDYDGNGTYDYRGVYFTQYRPYGNSLSSSSSNSNQDDNAYLTKKTYWFSFDPIEWTVLKESSNGLLIISNIILDAQNYNPNESTEEYEHNDGNGYTNNYELSSIRYWLNYDFYNTCFNDLEKQVIEVMQVDNSSKSAYYGTYCCDDTFDNVTLLSYKDANNYFSTNATRRTWVSDYSRAQGVYVCDNSSYWWTRTPGHLDAYDACSVGYTGEVNIGAQVNNIFGIRPIIMIQ